MTKCTFCVFVFWMMVCPPILLCCCPSPRKLLYDILLWRKESGRKAKTEEEDNYCVCVCSLWRTMRAQYSTHTYFLIRSIHPYIYWSKKKKKKESPVSFRRENFHHPRSSLIQAERRRHYWPPPSALGCKRVVLRLVSLPPLLSLSNPQLKRSKDKREVRLVSICSATSYLEPPAKKKSATGMKDEKKKSFWIIENRKNSWVYRMRE